MPAHNAARNDQAQSRASRVLAPRRFEPNEGLEHPLQIGLRIPRLLVLDDDVDLLAVPVRTVLWRGFRVESSGRSGSGGHGELRHVGVGTLHRTG